MQYKTFKLTDVKGINAFLASHDPGIMAAKDSLKMMDGMMHITFDERSSAQQEVDTIVGALDLFIIEKRSEFLGADEDERLARADEKLTVKGASPRVDEAIKRGQNILAAIRVANEIREEVVMGTWLGLSKNANKTRKK